MIEKMDLRAALEAAFEAAIKEVGIDNFKATSMFPLSRRKAAAVELKLAA